MKEATASNWDKIFTGDFISFPTYLTEKAKSKPKLKGAIEQAKKDFDKVTWIAYQPTDRAADIQQTTKDCEDFHKDNKIVKLRASLETLALLAKTEKEDNIKKVAEYMKSQLEPKNLKTQLEKVQTEWGKKQQEKALKNLAPSLKAFKDVAAKAGGVIDDLIQKFQAVETEDIPSKTTNDIGHELRDLCRDMTQPLGNVLKAVKAGAEVKNSQEMDELFEKLVPFSNCKSHTEFLPSDSDRFVVGQTIKKVTEMVREFKKFSQSL